MRQSPTHLKVKQLAYSRDGCYIHTVAHIIHKTCPTLYTVQWLTLSQRDNAAILDNCFRTKP